MRSVIAFKVLIFFFCALFLSSFHFAGCAWGLELRSPAFEEGETIPERYTCKGEDVSPALSWSGAPEGTRSFVLIMDDPDAPLGTWVHWVAYNIPGDATELEEDLPKKHLLDNGMMQGITSFRRIGYGGPCPPSGPAHRYFFKLYAIDTVLDLPPGANKGAVVRAIQGHILGTAQLMGLFKR